MNLSGRSLTLVHASNKGAISDATVISHAPIVMESWPSRQDPQDEIVEKTEK